MGKIVGILSIKGGVGKTTLVQSLASCMANDFGLKVLVVDGNYQAPTLGIQLGYLEAEKTLHDALKGKIKLREAIYATEHNFYLLPGSLVGGQVQPKRMNAKLKELRRGYDVVLVDTSACLEEDIVPVMKEADELYAIATPDYPSLTCTLKMVNTAKEHDTEITGLILNRLDAGEERRWKEELEDACGVRALGCLPEDESVRSALKDHLPPPLHKPRSEFARRCRKLAARMTGFSYQEPSFLDKLKSKRKKEKGLF